ncbi:Restriction of telomere capping protein 1 [Nakaseomyces bracarensis]|uniref:Restriction of telomere capping protein 1 n=1 Tax=Nakaseomyces bracarensis TaxID=273131 RepID=A0ABR4NT49_9SACH
MTLSPNKIVPAGSGSGSERGLNRTSSSIGKAPLKGALSQTHIGSGGHLYMLDPSTRPKLTAKYSYGSGQGQGAGQGQGQAGIGASIGLGTGQGYGMYESGSFSRTPLNSYGSSYEDKLLGANRRRMGGLHGSQYPKPLHPHHHSNSYIHNRTKNQVKHESKKSTTKFHFKTNYEISSIDKVNDHSSQGIVCAGKQHLGYYKFSTVDNSIVCVHDFIQSTNTATPKNNQWILPNLSKRTKGAKISNTADIKCGFQNYSHMFAVCNNSTDISLYDMNKSGNIDNPLTQVLSGHTRAINSFDFNMAQTQLLISGGQDGCVKVWDLRTNSMKQQGRSDINIRTTYDAIRDVKWMPSYNFGSFSSSGDPKIPSTATPGYTFASIHDTGVLLKYDIRQPNQVERKINVHSGPGLCLNWHPHQDYIATGGRDGKCSVWYVGDRKQSESTPISSTFLPQQNIPSASHANYIGSSVSSTILPEMTINTGSAVTKLKFRPNYDKILSNSLIAMSSMGDEAEVNIYALARKYIPKHLLTTGNSSLGLVWWDSNLIFNIDKAGYINGWDISNEPTVLDQLPKNIVKWRDVDGSGLLFLNQEYGSYEISEQEDYSERVTFQKQHSPTVKTDTPTPSTSLMANIKRGLSNSSVNYNSERATPKRPTFGMGSKNQLSSMTLSSVNKSSTSLSTMATQDEILENKFLRSPLIVTIDLPEAYQNTRKSRIIELNKKSYLPKVSSIRASNIEIFKFLARELEFSFRQEKMIDQNYDLSREQSANDENIKQNLMKRFDIAENATWANIVKEKTDRTRERTHSTSTRRSSTTNDPSEADTELLKSYNTNESKSKFESNITKEIQQEQNQIKSMEDRVKILLELVESSNHNASVYSIIEDLPNFKTWIMIRDSLLWDLKVYTSFDGQDLGMEGEVHKSPLSTNITRQHSLLSDFSRLGTSEISSEYAEHPRPYHGKSEGSSEASEDAKSPVSMLGEQLKKEENKFLLGRRFSSASPSKSPDVLKLSPPVKLSEHYVGSNRDSEIESSAIEEDEEEEADDEIDDDVSFSQKPHRKSSSKRGLTEGIPILNKREARTSFIDTFMNNDQSPEPFNNSMYYSRKQSPGFSYTSPKHTISSARSFSATPSKLALLKKFSSRNLASSPPTTRTASFNYTPDNSSVAGGRPTGPISCEEDSTPPWSTSKLLKQLHSQAIEMGNVILAVNILILFQDVYHIAPIEIVKDSVVHFVRLLHQYELFEIAAAILKYCPWTDLLGPEGDQSTIEIFCDRCGDLLTNETSKMDQTREIGFWYCDSCSKPNTLCTLCNCPLKKMTLCVLRCGHELHFHCAHDWFLKEQMSHCPAGCPAPPLL